MVYIDEIALELVERINIIVQLAGITFDEAAQLIVDCWYEYEDADRAAAEVRKRIDERGYTHEAKQTQPDEPWSRKDLDSRCKRTPRRYGEAD